MTCARCRLTIAPYAERVEDQHADFHKACFEADYAARHKRPPRLLHGGPGARHVFRQVSEVSA